MHATPSWIALALALAGLAAPGSAGAASGTWERAWGKDVVQAGAPGDTGTGFEVCVAASSCKGGSAGTLGGAFAGNSPRGVATDAQGNVYVVDISNHRIQKFDLSGTFERAWGKDVVAGNAETGYEICVVAASCQAGGQGGLGGEFNFPQGVATDPAGNVYVVDFFNQRVQKFNSSGGFLRTWGKNVDQTGGAGAEVCTAAPSCQTGAAGGLGGELSNPSNLAADTQGNVYVGEIAGQRVQKFDASGAFLRAWGKDVVQGGVTEFETCTVASTCQAGTAGGLGGEFDRPWVGADAFGNVYVADQLNNRIQKFDSSGTFLRAWGKDVDQTGGTGFEICVAAASCQAGPIMGSLGGEFWAPTGVAADPQGDVYVGDVNQRIQKFDPSGTFLRAWGKDVDQAGGTGFEICVAPTSCKAGGFGGLGGEFQFPASVASDAQGNIYVGDESGSRIQKFADPSQGGGGGGGEGGGDTTAPETTITKHPNDKTKKKTATFEFTGTDARAIASFECSLDGGGFAACTSPHTVKVKKGKHTFQVQATDAAGNSDPTPATDTWKRKKRKK